MKVLQINIQEVKEHKTIVINGPVARPISRGGRVHERARRHSVHGWVGLRLATAGALIKQQFLCKAVDHWAESGHNAVSWGSEELDEDDWEN